ncbi:hypothetical protein EVAR_59212_1 [Eumeta japonica]|uniref:Uncharacterized protein n=1 Tax=Eumeta variegata TaxID=151549 RepID=A0A4C1YT94_EUMVA|nr:hypothetical protein EVAR_59212_1 [Eumeta japonica]
MAEAIIRSKASGKAREDWAIPTVTCVNRVPDKSSRADWEPTQIAKCERWRRSWTCRLKESSLCGPRRNKSYTTACLAPRWRCGGCAYDMEDGEDAIGKFIKNQGQ